MTPPAGEGLIFVISGPGGVGKGTIVRALVERDPRLWLSRSWTTRPRRRGEPADAYTFTTRSAFEEHIRHQGFLEWTEFLGNYYGTPRPDPHQGRDTVLEIEVDGARQVKAIDPSAVLIFVLPPSREEQVRRLVARGDPPEHIQQRILKAEVEEPIGRALADHVVVNDDLGRTVEEMMAIISGHRRDGARRPTESPRTPRTAGQRR